MNRVSDSAFARRVLPVFAIAFGLAAGPCWSQSANLSGIAHVALRVSDLEKSRGFYQKLGFEQAFQFDEGGKVTQAFIKINDRQFIELYPRTQDGQSVGLMHVCYESDHIEDVRNAYLKAGLSPTDVKKARAGNLLFVLHDPEGQLVEYTQYMPGSLHFEDRGKHLGEHRISKQLQSVTISVKDASMEKAFYVEKLGFQQAAVHDERVAVLVPGGDGTLSFVEAGNAQLLFPVQNTRGLEGRLHKIGLAVRMQTDRAVLSDPDGNEIIFEKSSKQHGRVH
jgi:catechol 2,3-dioxygenase-like lactoylglutathione lyase family enzyme